MRFLHVNALGAAERRTLNGRHYLVAPVTMLVPGVLSGSQGPLLYPADEVAKDVQRWNHVPVTLGHPTDGHGRPISGRTDLALEKYQLGFILNTRFDGALRAEAWFDEELVRRKAPTLLDRLRSRTVTELSTGLFTTDQPVRNGVHSDGRPYVAVAREYRPDHLAILLDVKGACSAKDGCGVLVNAKGKKGGKSGGGGRWVTLDGGQRVYLGPGGEVKPGGPGGESVKKPQTDKKKEKEKPKTEKTETGRKKGESHAHSAKDTPESPTKGKPTQEDEPQKPAWDDDIRRSVTPSHGYHVTDRDNLASIAAVGLKPGAPQKSMTGKGVYFADEDQYEGAGGSQHESEVSLRARIPQTHHAYDDSEVHEYNGKKGDPTKPREGSAFYTPRGIAPEHLDVIDRKTGKAIPLLEYVSLHGIKPEKAEHISNARYSFDSEECPHCKAVMEGDPDSGRCNRCRRRHGKWVGKGKEKGKENAHGQPHSSDTGRFKRPNAGTGKADTRDHALLGAMVLSDEDVAIGRASAVEIALQGHNPPSWVKDEARWEKAKEAARKGGYAGDTFWAVVAHVYRNMGGAMKRSAGAKGKGKKGKAKRNALVANYIRKKGDKYCVYSSSGKKLGEYPTREAAEKRLRQIEYFKHKSNQTPTRGEARTMPKFTTRKDAEGHLTANCACWRGEEKARALAALPDDAVLEIANNAVEAEESSLVVNSLRGALGLDDEADLSQINTALETAVKANQTDPDDDDADDDDAGDDEMMKKYPKKNQEQTVTLNKQTLLAELGKLSQDEILGLPGMAGLRERDQLAQQILNRGKEEYVDRLTANISDLKQREARKAHLRKLTLNELQDRLQDLPPVQTQNSARPAPAVYLGAGPTSFSPSRDDDYRPKPMEFPAINWAEEKKLLDAQQKLRAG